MSLLSLIKPKIFNQDNIEEIWINAMKEELNQIEKSGTWELLPRPKNKNVIGTKWLFKNKLNVNGES